ncbi:MAG: hypothetical protein EH225_01820 [Calditrichaeota bacterium]|nr:MAG: hypothetical protein EH225_01820 [Calditrichota bacterium]
MKGEPEKAEKITMKFLKQVQEIRNTFQTWLAHELLGMIYFYKQDYQTALEEFELSNLQNPYNLYRLALVWRAMGDSEKAGKYALQALNHNTLNSIQYAFVRHKARKLAESL